MTSSRVTATTVLFLARSVDEVYRVWGTTDGKRSVYRPCVSHVPHQREDGAQQPTTEAGVACAAAAVAE
jgi:hypothetical protein